MTEQLHEELKHQRSNNISSFLKMLAITTSVAAVQQILQQHYPGLINQPFGTVAKTTKPKSKKSKVKT